MVMNAWNLTTWETEVQRLLQVLGHPDLYSTELYTDDSVMRPVQLELHSETVYKQTNKYFKPMQP